MDFPRPLLHVELTFATATWIPRERFEMVAPECLPRVLVVGNACRRPAVWSLRHATD